MTSDAKIGLLLGLVFIIVIALIINGLPNFSNHATAEATQMAMSIDGEYGIVDSARSGQERLDWKDLLAQEGEDLVDIPEPEPATTRSDLTTDIDSSGARRVYTLDDLVGGMSGKIQSVVKNLIETVPPQEQATTTEPAPAIETPKPKPEPVQTKPVETAATRPTTPQPAATQRPAPAGTKIYVVEDGDVLATVAKKAYGPEEGNRLVNVNRIFEANRDKLKSPDEIVVGQKLVIPPLSASKPEAGAADPKLSEALFEKVEQIGKRNLADIKETKPEGRFYVVQDGDSLWKIAGSQLGSGARWEEIVKLNTSTLKSKEATLVIGMQLRLPAK